MRKMSYDIRYGRGRRPVSRQDERANSTWTNSIREGEFNLYMMTMSYNLLQWRTA